VLKTREITGKAYKKVKEQKEEEEDEEEEEKIIITRKTYRFKPISWDLDNHWLTPLRFRRSATPRILCSRTKRQAVVSPTPQMPIRAVERNPQRGCVLRCGDGK